MQLIINQSGLYTTQNIIISRQDVKKMEKLFAEPIKLNKLEEEIEFKTVSITKNFVDDPYFHMTLTNEQIEIIIEVPESNIEQEGSCYLVLNIPEVEFITN